MNLRKKNLLSVLGALSMIFGLAVSFPSYLNTDYFGFGISIVLIVIGSVFLAIAYGGE